jgi:hypothetical protein
MTGQRFPVEAGHIALFARALGDESPGLEVTALASEAGGPTAELAVSTRNQHGAEVLAGAATARLERSA